MQRHGSSCRAVICDIWAAQPRHCRRVRRKARPQPSPGTPLTKMATIHSLPTELIHHVLALAFPDHASDPSPTQARSRAALARAAGVHSSWCAPAQDLLTQSLHFDWRNLASREVCGRFADSGPTRGRSRCRALRVAQFDGRVVRRVLERVAGGAVRELTLEGIVGLAEGDVFGSESLSSESGFRTGAGFPCHCGGADA